MYRTRAAVTLCREFQISVIKPEFVDRVVTLYRNGRLASDSDVYPEYAQATFDDDAFYTQFRDKLHNRVASDMHATCIHNEGGDIVGFSVMGPLDDALRGYVPNSDAAVELHQIYVDPAHQRKGYGSRLWDALTDTARLNGRSAMMINVLGSATCQNTAAIAFYNAKGAKTVGFVDEDKKRMGKIFKLRCPVLLRNLG